MRLVGKSILEALQVVKFRLLMVLGELRGRDIEVGEVLRWVLVRDVQPLLAAPKSCGQPYRIGGVVLIVQQLAPRVDDELGDIHGSGDG